MLKKYIKPEINLVIVQDNYANLLVTDSTGTHFRYYNTQQYYDPLEELDKTHNYDIWADTLKANGLWKNKW